VKKLRANCSEPTPDSEGKLSKNVIALCLLDWPSFGEGGFDFSLSFFLFLCYLSVYLFLSPPIFLITFSIIAYDKAQIALQSLRFRIIWIVRNCPQTSAVEVARRQALWESHNAEYLYQSFCLFSLCNKISMVLLEIVVTQCAD
jgi:hypothetical protein